MWQNNSVPVLMATKAVTKHLSSTGQNFSLAGSYLKHVVASGV